jgi:hypothetical protein
MVKIPGEESVTPAAYKPVLKFKFLVYLRTIFQLHDYRTGGGLFPCKPRKPSGRLAGFKAKTRTQNLLNTGR